MAGRKVETHGLFGFCSGMIDNPNYETEMNEYKLRQKQYEEDEEDEEKEEEKRRKRKRKKRNVIY